jgi:hypothetical protein
LEAAKYADPAPTPEQLQWAREMATWLGQSVSTPEEAWDRMPVRTAPRSGSAEFTPEMRAWLDGRGAAL